MDGSKPHQRDIQSGCQRTGDGDDGQAKEQERVVDPGSDLFLGKQLDHICKGLEPARSHAVLEAGDQFAVDPLVEHTRQKKRQAGGKNQ